MMLCAGLRSPVRARVAPPGISRCLIAHIRLATWVAVLFPPHAQYRAMTLDPRALGEQIAAAVDISSPISRASELFVPDSRRAWTRLVVAVLIGSLGSVGMWSVVVVLPVVQADFGVARGTA